MKNKELLESINQLDALEQTQEILEIVTNYSQELLTKRIEDLHIIEQLWLLAYEASETRIVRMGEDDNEETKNSFINSILILNQSVYLKEKLIKVINEADTKWYHRLFS